MTSCRKFLEPPHEVILKEFADLRPYTEFIKAM